MRTETPDFYEAAMDAARSRWDTEDEIKAEETIRARLYNARKADRHNSPGKVRRVIQEVDAAAVDAGEDALLGACARAMHGLRAAVRGATIHA